MGYNVYIQESTFTIPYENLEEAYERMCKLNFTVPNTQKRGGSWPGKDTAPEYGPDENCWFSWMNWNYHETCETAEEILISLGFDTEADNIGNLKIVDYGSKTGQEDLFLASICDLASGHIIWKGEDDTLWGETYGGQSPIVKTRIEDYSDLIAV